MFTRKKKWWKVGFQNVIRQLYAIIRIKSRLNAIIIDANGKYVFFVYLFNFFVFSCTHVVPQDYCAKWSMPIFIEFNNFFKMKSHYRAILVDWCIFKRIQLALIVFSAWFNDFIPFFVFVLFSTINLWNIDIFIIWIIDPIIFIDCS